MKKWKFFLVILVSGVVGVFFKQLAFVLISKLYRQMYANTGIATDSARRANAIRWSRIIAKPCHALFSARPLPHLQAPAARSVMAAAGPGRLS